jgi:hypothetical protein
MRNFQSQQFRYQRIHTHVFKRTHGYPCADIRPRRKKKLAFISGTRAGSYPRAYLPVIHNRRHRNRRRRSPSADAFSQSVLQSPDLFIDHLHCRANFFTIRPMFLPRMIDIRKMERNQMRPLLRWQTQPRQRLFHALVIRKFLVILQIIRRPRSLNLRLRARPEETC